MTEPIPPGDPRVYFAAERTLLAWLRTGIAIMAFGFVVARFGLFLRLLRVQGGTVPGHGISPYLGAALVLVGALASAGGTLEYRRYLQRIPPADLPREPAPLLPLVLAWTLVVMGLALTVILLA
jgi:putative membrane protein